MHTTYTQGEKSLHCAAIYFSCIHHKIVFITTSLLLHNSGRFLNNSCDFSSLSTTSKTYYPIIKIIGIYM